MEPAASISGEMMTALESDFRVSGHQFFESETMMLALQGGDIDIAIIEQVSEPIEGLAAILPIYPSVLHILIGPDLMDERTEIEDFHSFLLSGSVDHGRIGSASYNLLERLGEHGVGPDIEDLILHDEDSGQMPDIRVLFGGILTQEAITDFQDYRLASLGKLEELGQGALVEGLSLRFPNIEPFIIPKALYPQLASEAALSLSIPSLLVARSDLPESDVYAVAHSVTRQVSTIRSIHPLAYSRETMLQPNRDYVLPLHQGALDLIERHEPGLLERYAEVLALALTLVIASSSLILGILRSRAQARKDRIDVYFSKLLELRTQMADSSLPELEVMEAVSRLQAVVTNLVVEERVAADSAYVSFIALSNQILQEAQAQRAGIYNAQNAQ